MANEINTACLAVQTVVSAIPGISQTLYPPTDQLNYNPAAIVYPVQGDLDNMPTGTRRDLFSINVEILMPIGQQKLDDALRTLIPFLDSIAAALQAQVSNTSGNVGARFPDTNGNATISAFSGTHFTFLPNVDYAGVPMRGYRFTMKDVKILVLT